MPVFFFNVRMMAFYSAVDVLFSTTCIDIRSEWEYKCAKFANGYLDLFIKENKKLVRLHGL